MDGIIIQLHANICIYDSSSRPEIVLQSSCSIYNNTLQDTKNPLPIQNCRFRLPCHLVIGIHGTHFTQCRINPRIPLRDLSRSFIGICFTCSGSPSSRAIFHPSFSMPPKFRGWVAFKRDPFNVNCKNVKITSLTGCGGLHSIAFKFLYYRCCICNWLFQRRDRWWDCTQHAQQDPNAIEVFISITIVKTCWKNYFIKMYGRSSHTRVGLLQKATSNENMYE